MNLQSDFTKAINEKRVVIVKFESKDRGVISRRCIPFDFGPYRRNISPNPEKYHLFDLNSPEGGHNLSLLPSQIISLEILSENFDPADFITWQPNWFISRNWGAYS